MADVEKEDVDITGTDEEALEDTKPIISKKRTNKRVISSKGAKRFKSSPAKGKTKNVAVRSKPQNDMLDVDTFLGQTESITSTPSNSDVDDSNDGLGSIVSIKSTSNASDIEDTTNRMKNTHIQKSHPILIKQLSIPLVRVDAKPYNVKSIKKTPKVPVAKPNTSLKTFVFEDDETQIKLEDIKEEPSFENTDREPSPSLQKDNEAEGQSKSEEEPFGDADSEDNYEPDESASSEQDDMESEQEGTVPEPTNRPLQPPPNKSSDPQPNAPPKNNENHTDTDDNTVKPNDIATFLQSVYKDMKKMSLDDANEVQSQIEKLMRMKRLSILQRKTDVVQNNNGQQPTEQALENVVRRSANQNSTIIYMTYDKGDDEDMVDENGDTENGHDNVNDTVNGEDNVRVNGGVNGHSNVNGRVNGHGNESVTMNGFDNDGDDDIY